MTTTILFDGDKVEQLHDLTDGPERLRGSMLLWVDLDDLSADSVCRVADEFDLDEESRERLASSSGGTFSATRASTSTSRRRLRGQTPTMRRAKSSVSSATTGW